LTIGEIEHFSVYDIYMLTSSRM